MRLTQRRRELDGQGGVAYLPGMLIDSHCHLNYPKLVERQADTLAAARAAGVTGMLNISTRECEWADVIATAEREPDVWAAIGIHPHEADAHTHVDAARLIEVAQHPRVVGIGESGLDYHYDHSDRVRQRANFHEHIDAARETGLPLIIHTRDAEKDTAAILRAELAKGTFPALIHCFTGTRAFADEVLELGLLISISGIVTFRNAADLADTAAAIPGDRLLIETDAPFLAPVPHRGRPCEPAFVADTARFLAKRRNEDPTELMTRTARNFLTLFTRIAA